MKPIFDLLDDRPGNTLIAVRDAQDRHIIGTVQQLAAHKFRAHGPYFDCTFSDIEYAKACFIQEQKAEPLPVVNNQLTLSI